MPKTPNQPARNVTARRRLSQALAKQARTPVAESASNAFLGFTGTWVAAESYDANLSKILINGYTFRAIPCISSVATLGLTANCVVLVAKIGTQFVLLGRLYGNPASAPTTTIAHS
jgi:hypothetical protein